MDGAAAPGVTADPGSSSGTVWAPCPGPVFALGEDSCDKMQEGSGHCGVAFTARGTLPRASPYSPLCLSFPPELFCRVSAFSSFCSCVSVIRGRKESSTGGTFLSVLAGFCNSVTCLPSGRKDGDIPGRQRVSTGSVHAAAGGPDRTQTFAHLLEE